MGSLSETLQKRHRQDKEINNRQVKVLRGDKFESVAWQDVHVGDIVKVKNRNYVPADLVLISTSEPLGLCYIETANLDGYSTIGIAH